MKKLLLVLLFVPLLISCSKDDGVAKIYFENGTCKCTNASPGDSAMISGTLYTVVDNSTIAGQISAGNVNLCTTLVTDMGLLFKDDDSFNSDIGFWDTSSVTDMLTMFDGASAFNQDIGSWDTSKVTTMMSMFREASAFNQDLTGWCVSNFSSEPNGFSASSALTDANKPVWGTCPD